MSLGTTISRAEAEARTGAWQSLPDNQLAKIFTSESARNLVYELSGDPLDAMMEQWDQTEGPRFRMHAAVGEDGSFEVLFEILSGSRVTELQADTIYVPTLTSAEIAVPNPEPPTPSQEIAPSEAKTMTDEWQSTAAAEIAGTVTGSEGRLQSITYDPGKSSAMKNHLDKTSDLALQVFLAVKTPDFQAKYEDDSDTLFTFVCAVAMDETSGIPENGYFEFGSLCPPVCQ